jgi:outer membrane protein TolC
MATLTHMSLVRTALLVALNMVSLTFTLVASGQGVPAQVPDTSTSSPGANNAPITLTFQDALQRARTNNPQYRSALTELGLAKEDRVQSRAALLPNVNYNAAFIYTQGTRNTVQPGCTPPNCTAPVPRFIANNGVHEYISQGDIHQDLSLGKVADYRRTAAAAAVAAARAEIAARGLVVTVARAYYAFVSAQQKYGNKQRAAAEAQRFLDISQKLEHGGEVAHSDVIKAQKGTTAGTAAAAGIAGRGTRNESEPAGTRGYVVPELQSEFRRCVRSAGSRALAGVFRSSVSRRTQES